MEANQLRYDGVDADHLAWMLSALDGRLDQAEDPTDYRLHRDYVARAHVRFGAGFHPGEVHHDLLWASRCLAFNDAAHFEAFAPARFRSRRIDPVEIALAGGDLMMAERTAERYSVPVSTIVAGMASDSLMREVRTVTRCFDGPPRDELDVAGLGAIAWSSALGCAVRGFDDEAKVSAGLFLQLCEESLHGQGVDGPLGRFKRLFDLLGMAVAGDLDGLSGGLGAHLGGHEAALRSEMSEEHWRKPPIAPRYFDVTSCALAALVAHRGGTVDVSLFPPEAERFAGVVEAELVAQDGEAAAEALAAAAAAEGLAMGPQDPTSA